MAASRRGKACSHVCAERIVHALPGGDGAPRAPSVCHPSVRLGAAIADSSPQIRGVDPETTLAPSEVLATLNSTLD
jgi:hypothetical protein